MRYTSTLKKIIFTLIALTLFLQANYKNAVIYYNQKNYIKAIEELKNSLSEYNNLNLHLLWAKSAQKLGKTTEAMAAYERVLLFDASHQEAKKALKDIYIDTNRVALSDTLLIKQNLRVKFYGGLGFGYDSNIDINPGASALDEYYDISSNVEPLDTAFVRVNAQGLLHYTFEKNEKWFTQTTLNLYNQTNFDASRYDLTKLSLEGAIGYSDILYRFYLPISYHKMLFFEKNLLSDYTINPNLKMAIFENSVLDMGIEYTKRAYVHQEDKSRDSDIITGNIGLYFYLFHTPLHLNIEREERLASQTQNARYIESTFHAFEASINYQLSSQIALNAHNILRYAHYKDDIGTQAIPAQTRRRDYINQSDFQINYTFNQKATLYLLNTYTKSYSNYLPAQYSKNVLLLGMNYKF